MERLNRFYLGLLVSKRDASEIPASTLAASHGALTAISAYYQGRIDEFCAQNAISPEDAPDLDLKLNEEGIT